MYSGQGDYYRYSYCGALLLIGFLINLAAICKIFYDRRRGGSIRRRGIVNSSLEKLTGFYLSFTILTCFVASSNFLLLITRDLGHLLETATNGDWRSTNFTCKLYKFSTFLAYHLCAYSVLAMVGCTCWYACTSKRTIPKQNRIGMIVAIFWALAVAFCAPLYHVAGLSEQEDTGKQSTVAPDGKRQLCYTIRPYHPGNTDLVFLYYPYFLIGTILVAPSVTILVCYVLAGRKIMAQRRSAENPVSVRLVQFAAVPTTVEGEDRDEIDESSEGARLTPRSRPLETPEGELPSKAEQKKWPKKDKMPLSNPRLEIVETSTMADQDEKGQVTSAWKICRVAAIVALTYMVCWLPYAIVYLLVAKGDLDPDMLSITIPTYMLFLLYPIISGVALIV